MVMKEILNFFQKLISQKSTAEGIVTIMQFINYQFSLFCGKHPQSISFITREVINIFSSI
jgi:hypothetical protein